MRSKIFKIFWSLGFQGGPFFLEPPNIGLKQLQSNLVSDGILVKSLRQVLSPHQNTVFQNVLCKFSI